MAQSYTHGFPPGLLSPCCVRSYRNPPATYSFPFCQGRSPLPLPTASNASSLGGYLSSICLTGTFPFELTLVGCYSIKELLPDLASSSPLSPVMPYPRREMNSSFGGPPLIYKYAVEFASSSNTLKTRPTSSGIIDTHDRSNAWTRFLSSSSTVRDPQ
jgi:hypothetical protein